MKKIPVIVLLSVVFQVHGLACINEYRARVDGSIEEMAIGGTRRLSPRFDRSYVLARLKVADSLFQMTGDLKDLSDYAAMLIYAGRYHEALAIFQEIEKSRPGLYNTAANMGTVFELLDEPDSALFWILRAVQINPESHQGSEWIHVKILEAKVKFRNADSGIWQYDFLALGFGNKNAPVNSRNHDLLLLFHQLRFQIMERIYFASRPDPILARLLFDFGNVVALQEDVKSALPVFEQAEEYGLKSDLLLRRKTYFQRLQQKAELLNHPEEQVAKSNKDTLRTLVFATLLIVGIVAFLFFVRRN